MALLVKNTTGAPITLAAGIPPVTVPAGTIFNATGETATFAGPDWAALEAQRIALAGGLLYWWSTGQVEGPTGTLTVATSATSAEAQHILAVGNVYLYGNAVSGNDANDGTITRPVATLGRLFQLLPVAWPGQCRIRLAAGTYDLPLRWTTGGPVAGGQRLLIEGHMNEVIATRTITGVAFDARSCLVITDNTLAMTPGAHRLMYVEFLTGSLAGWRYPVIGNTAIDLTLLKGNIGLVPAPGDTFRVVVPDVVLRTPALTDGTTYTSVLAAFKDCDISMDPSPLSYEQDCSMMFDTCRFTNSLLGILRILNVSNGEVSCGPLNSDVRHEFDDFPQSYSDRYANGVVLQSVVATVGTAGMFRTTSLVHDGGNFSVGFSAQEGGSWSAMAVDAISLFGLSFSAASRGIMGLGSSPVGAAISRVQTPSPAPLSVTTGGMGRFYNVQALTTNINGNGVSVVDPGSVAELTGITTPSPIARYGISVTRGAYCNVDATTTANGGLGNFVVDSVPGSYANNRVNGICSNLGSQLDGGAPVLHSVGPHLNGGTAHNMSLVVQIAVGASTATVTNSTIRAASALRGTILQGQAGVGLQSVTPGAGSVTVTLSAPAAATPVDVLVENIGN